LEIRKFFMEETSFDLIEMKQQDQTKIFFENFAKKWAKNSKNTDLEFVNVIKQRNDFVEKIAEQYISKGDSTLDVGCGTGDLVIDLIKRGYKSIGIDFSKDMIKEAKFFAKSKGIADKNFINISFFDYNSDKKLNLISANGFIEYISYVEFIEFVKKSYNMLEDNGILVFGSRNRLFNIFSFNDFTNQEISLNTIQNLIKECISFSKSDNLKDILNSKFHQNLSENIKKHKNTGINVDTRFQYTPFQIIDILKQNNFKILDLYPNHIHLLSTGAKDISPEIHGYLSNLIQEKNELHLRLIPQSSSFMIAVRK